MKCAAMLSPPNNPPVRFQQIRTEAARPLAASGCTAVQAGRVRHAQRRQKSQKQRNLCQMLCNKSHVTTLAAHGFVPGQAALPSLRLEGNGCIGRTSRAALPFEAGPSFCCGGSMEPRQCSQRLKGAPASREHLPQRGAPAGRSPPLWLPLKLHAASERSTCRTQPALVAATQTACCRKGLERNKRGDAVLDCQPTSTRILASAHQSWGGRGGGHLAASESTLPTPNSSVCSSFPNKASASHGERACEERTASCMPPSMPRIDILNSNAGSRTQGHHRVAGGTDAPGRDGTRSGKASNAKERSTKNARHSFGKRSSSSDISGNTTSRPMNTTCSRAATAAAGRQASQPPPGAKTDRATQGLQRPLTGAGGRTEPRGAATAMVERRAGLDAPQSTQHSIMSHAPA
jgi:hypothetical protein